MVEMAHRTYPNLRFEVGSMTAVDLTDGELGGIVATEPTSRPCCGGIKRGKTELGLSRTTAGSTHGVFFRR